MSPADSTLRYAAKLNPSGGLRLTVDAPASASLFNEVRTDQANGTSQVTARTARIRSATILDTLHGFSPGLWVRAYVLMRRSCG
ncbi:hypothetical protein GCM10010530_43000 [Kribbella aluminosa]